LRPASADASFRRYFRIDRASGRGSVIVMDAPPALEDNQRFARVADMFIEMQLNVPKVLDADFELGFLILSDLGQESYLSALQARPASAERLYDDALRALHKLQSAGMQHVDELPEYDEQLLQREMSLFRDWLCGRHLNLDWSNGDEHDWAECCDSLVASALSQPRVFVHRDFHSRNLMVTEENNPGILDFQDAVAGPLTYDLVSLLKDCYVSWPSQQVREWAQRFHTMTSDAHNRCGEEVVFDEKKFLRQFDLMGVQRHLKAAGIFSRLLHRDGKSGYMADVPRTLGYIVAIAADYPELEWLGELIRNRVLPVWKGKY